MIPLHLSLSGLLSYRDLVEIDFAQFDLACISGPNGAGKSSLLDAITWALFGQARKRDEALINAQSESAQVRLVFTYEGNVYKVERTMPRGKTTQLEFQILQNAGSSDLYRQGRFILPPNAAWKSLNERTLRETQALIEQTLRLDYDTFVNASFFLQGKADLFTQQRPGDRKRILGSILGLEIWERYRQEASDRRKNLENEQAHLQGRLDDIERELSEEGARKTELARLESRLAELVKIRTSAETTLETARQLAALLANQRKLFNGLSERLATAERNQAGLEQRLAARQQERQGYLQAIERAGEIEASYATWQQARQALETWEATAARFSEQEKLRQRPMAEIRETQARLEQELKGLNEQQRSVERLQTQRTDLLNQLEVNQRAALSVEKELKRREQIETRLIEIQSALAQAEAEMPVLMREMNQLKTRIQSLSNIEGAECPLCGQPLPEQSRLDLLNTLRAEGTEMGNRYREHQRTKEHSDHDLEQQKRELAAVQSAEQKLRSMQQALVAASARLESLEEQIEQWVEKGEPRQQELKAILESEAYAEEARLRLAEIDRQLKEIGYAAADHDQARRKEASLRSSEAALLGLERARAALEPLERQIAEMQEQASRQQEELAQQRAEHDQMAAELAAQESVAPDPIAAERELRSAQLQENQLRQEVGAAHQKVSVLEDLKERRKSLIQRKESFAARIAHHKQLERAFSKDGVPALLIEQALPQIEEKANQILDRLSGGNLRVTFVTQAAYKDKKRDDLRETLDIQISDPAGTRDYEMFSGGEAFRVNFAIRLALSEVLAQRAGARLQTLVIDEGFGSQDTQGRQRLIEAINQVRDDFSKILVITHIDELKDAFPNRIEVEKTPQGSRVTVL